jgi:hypothetical protein
MPNRSSKDINETAFPVIQATGQTPPPPAPKLEKNLAAVALGRLGGLNARERSLTAEMRQEIAKKAAESRWKREK